MPGVTTDMDDELQAKARMIGRASVPEDIFGADLSGSAEDKMHSVMIVYRQLMKTVHPDRHEKGNLTLANTAFRQLTLLKTQADEKIHSGTYGDFKPVPPKNTVTDAAMVFDTGKRRYIVGQQITVGDLCHLYTCTYAEDTKDNPVVFKIVSSHEDNDLLETEAKILTRIFPAKQANVKFYRYLPRLLDTFLAKGASGTQRRVNVLTPLYEFYSLANVLREYPKGIDFRDMVWMFKRTMAGIGFVHSQNVVHGALLPPHILIDPVDHGAKLIDWCYAVDITPAVVTPTKPTAAWARLVVQSSAPPGRVRAMVSAYKDYYPPEIPNKEIVTPATDIYMAAKCAVALLGGNVKTNDMPRTVPTEIRRFFEKCLVPEQKKRPNDAWALHEQLDELLVKLIGKPTYRLFQMPASK